MEQISALRCASIRLRYGYPDGTELHYEVAGSNLKRVDVLWGGRVLQEVELVVSAASPRPVEATYRHLTDFRELSLVRESMESVPSFSDEIWDPSR